MAFLLVLIVVECTPPAASSPSSYDSAKSNVMKEEFQLGAASNLKKERTTLKVQRSLLRT